jgi:hypothetical protein
MSTRVELRLGQTGTRSDIHALIDPLADEEFDAVRTVLNAVRAEDGFESLSEDDLERLRASVRRGLAQGEAGKGRSIEEFMKVL